MKKTFLITTLGCKVNSYESQAMKEMLINEGYVEDKDSPSVIIINSCAVTKMAEHKSRQKVSSFAKKYPSSVVVVTGCSAQLHKEDYINIDGTCIILGNNNHSKLIEYLNKYLENNERIVDVDKSTRNRTYQNLHITNYEEKARAFVKIGDGCNNFCSYCVIPLTRGNLRSRNKDEILCEIKALVANNFKEIVITGIDSASYGFEFDNYTFDDLLEEIVALEGLKRIRISSVEASQLNDRFMNLLKTNKKIMNHLHIPLQSGSDTVLERMRRKYTADEFYEKIKNISQSVEGCALACDVIVGFPGETEEEFFETCEFIKKCNFAFLHVFPYSPRVGTYAATMKNQIPANVKKDRVKRLIALGDILAENYKKSCLGMKVEVLVEEYDEKTKLYHGLSQNYLDVYFKSSKNILNEIIETEYTFEVVDLDK